jgi:hypothetical protein
MKCPRLIRRSITFAATIYILQFRPCNSRSWTAVLDPTSVNDGMPQRHSKNTEWIEIHGSQVPMFQELDATYVFTAEPSALPSMIPSLEPSVDPTAYPSKSPSRRPTSAPTSKPTYAGAQEPSNPPKGYFNYNPTSRSAEVGTRQSRK